MTVERAQFISQLDEQNPRSLDMIKEGDDHIRLTKDCTKSTFPRFDRRVDFSAEQLNKLYTWIMAVEDASDPEALQKFTVLDDMEIRKDLYFTEGGVDGTNTSTPESPKISGLSDIQFTTAEQDDPSTIPAEKLSRALNLRTADNRYMFASNDVAGSVSKLTFKNKDVAVATEGLLTVTEKVKAKTFECTDKVTVAETLTAKNVEVAVDLKVVGSIYRGSDANLKWNIEDLPVEITTEDVRPVQYFKEGKREFGVIAQEIPEYLDHMVDRPNFKGHLSVDYTQFIPILIKEIKELRAEVEALKNGS